MKKFNFNKKTNNLFEAILSLKTKKEAEIFFRDLCTTQEISAMTERWEIVKLLNKNLSYRQIAKKLNTSTTTVGRVASWYTNGEGGYKIIYDRLNKSTHYHNISPGEKDL